MAIFGTKIRDFELKQFCKEVIAIAQKADNEINKVDKEREKLIALRQRVGPVTEGQPGLEGKTYILERESRNFDKKNKESRKVFLRNVEALAEQLLKIQQ